MNGSTNHGIVVGLNDSKEEQVEALSKNRSNPGNKRGSHDGPQDGETTRGGQDFSGYFDHYTL